MLYVVFVAIDRDLADAWTTWMRETHVPDVLATGCFADALMLRDEAADTPERLGWRFVYRAHDADALARYQANFAAALQADHTDRFAGTFDARRELLPVVERFTPPNS